MSVSRVVALALASVSVVAASFAITRPADAQSATGTFASQTIQGRTVKVYTPSHPLAKPPLVLMLHGCTQDPDQFSTGTRMNDVAEQLGWVVAYPDQPSSANQNKCWNWYLPAHQSRNQGEPALLAAIVDTVVQQTGADPDRVYVAGISAGAAMSVILGATYPDKFAAIGVCSGLEYQAATDMTSAFTAMSSGGPSPTQQGDAAWRAMGSAARLVPTMVFHGTSDTTVAPVNGDQIVAQWARTDDDAPSGSPQGRITATPSSTTSGTAPGGDAYTVKSYNDATGRTVIEYVQVSGMGHAWSGGSSAGSYTEPKGPDASTMLCQFFTRFAQPGASTPPSPAPSTQPSPQPSTQPSPQPSTQPSPLPSSSPLPTRSPIPITTTQPLVTVADPPGGSYTGSVQVTLRPNRPATTYYTRDGSTPNKSSTVASGPITLTPGSAMTRVTLKFFSVDSKGATETVREETYSLTPGTPAPQPCPCSGPLQTLVLGSQAANDGSVSTLAPMPQVLLVGDMGAFASDSYRAVVSFDSSALPAGAKIASVKLVVVRQSLAGSLNPLVVDVNEGVLGSSAGIETADYSANTTFPGAATLAVPASDGASSEVDLPATTFGAVASGLVQVRLRESSASGSTPNQIFFVGAYDAANGPKLVVQYQH